MKRFRLLSLWTIFLFPYSLHAQMSLGVKGGLSLPNLSSAESSEVSKGYKTISGPDLAIVAEYAITTQFSIETGIEWSTQGGHKSGLQTIPATPELAQYFPPGSNIHYLYASFTSTVRLNYLMLPVLLKYYMNPGGSGKWRLYVDAGLFGALLVNAKGSASGTSKVYYDKAETQPVAPYPVIFDSTGDIKNQLHAGNFGMEGNVGMACQLASCSLFAEAGGNYGFINLQKNKENGINRTGALIFRIGCTVALK